MGPGLLQSSQLLLYVLGMPLFVDWRGVDRLYSQRISASLILLIIYNMQLDLQYYLPTGQLLIWWCLCMITCCVSILSHYCLRVFSFIFDCSLLARLRAAACCWASANTTSDSISSPVCPHGLQTFRRQSAVSRRPLQKLLLFCLDHF
jgi:hypothetical protein